MSRRISLSRELWRVIQSLEGLRHLADAWHEQPEGTRLKRALPHAMGAMLGILQDHLVMLDRVVNDRIDPGLLWSDANDAGVRLEPDDDPDVQLIEWSGKHSLKKAREELRRAKAYRRRQRRRP